MYGILHYLNGKTEKVTLTESAGDGFVKYAFPKDSIPETLDYLDFAPELLTSPLG